MRPRRTAVALLALICLLRSLAAPAWADPVSTSSSLSEEPGYLEKFTDKAARGLGMISLAPWRGSVVMCSHVTAANPLRFVEGLLAGLVKGAGTTIGDIVLGVGEFVTSPAPGFSFREEEELT